MKRLAATRMAATRFVLALTISSLVASCASVPHAGAPPPTVRSPFGGRTPVIPGIIEAEDFDNGPEGVAYHEGTPAQRGNRKAYRSGPVDLDNALDGKTTMVAFIQTDEWLAYTVEVAAAGSYDVEVSVSGEAARGEPKVGGFVGEFSIEFDGVDVTGPLVVPNTGSWRVFGVVMKTGVKLPAGIRTMRLKAGPRQGNFNWDSVKFTRNVSPPSAAAPPSALSGKHQ